MELPEEMPAAEAVDEDRRAKLMLAAVLVLSRESASPLERRWAKEVYDLCAALGDARS